MLGTEVIGQIEDLLLQEVQGLLHHRSPLMAEVLLPLNLKAWQQQLRTQ